jgi:hypothetical protein
LNNTDFTKTTTQKTKRLNNTDSTKTTTQKTKRLNNTDSTKTTTQKTKRLNNTDSTKTKTHKTFEHTLVVDTDSCETRQVSYQEKEGTAYPFGASQFTLGFLGIFFL